MWVSGGGQDSLNGRIRQGPAHEWFFAGLGSSQINWEEVLGGREQLYCSAVAHL